MFALERSPERILLRGSSGLPFGTLRNLSAKAAAKTRVKAIGSRKKQLGDAASVAGFVYFVGTNSLCRVASM